jgi:hypothetical protein
MTFFINKLHKGTEAPPGQRTAEKYPRFLKKDVSEKTHLQGIVGGNGCPFRRTKPTQRPDSGYNPEAIAQYLNQSLEKNQLELLLAAFALNVPVPWVPRPTPPKLGRPKKATSPEAGD